MPEHDHPTGPAGKTDKPPADKPAEKAPPTSLAVGNLVTYAYTHWNGAACSQTGIVVAVDTDNNSAAVNWLPDAVASVPFDDLEAVS